MVDGVVAVLVGAGAAVVLIVVIDVGVWCCVELPLLLLVH